MPRTQHLNHLTPNRIYAIDAQVKYTHSTPSMTTAVIEQENTQSLIKIPRTESLNIVQGASYHFGFCYIGRNGWINARHPSDSIVESHEQIIHEPHSLDEIASHSHNLNNHYLTTVLQVLKANPIENVMKDGKNLTVCVLNCFAAGFLVDVTLWNTQIDPVRLQGGWVLFSGFRLKQLTQGKFVLVSTVYSNMSPFQGNPGQLFSFESFYPNLSCAYEPRTTVGIQHFSQEKEKFYSEVKAVVNGIEVRNYEGCSVCRRKLVHGENCNCNPHTESKEYTIMKLAIADNEGLLEVSVFDEEIQRQLSLLDGPAPFILRIKTTTKKVEETILVSHIVSKAERV